MSYPLASIPVLNQIWHAPWWWLTGARTSSYEHMPNELPQDILPCAGMPSHMEHYHISPYHGTDYGNQYGGDGNMFLTWWIYAYHIGENIPSIFSIKIALPFTSLLYWQHICKLLTSTDWDIRQQITIPILFLCNKAVYGLPFQPHADSISIHLNDSGPC